MLQIIFFAAVGIVGYVYIGYPMVAWILGRLVGRGCDGRPLELPVTVVTAAYNERAHIRGTVINKLEQDYPEGLLDVIVVSDGSTDGTDEIVKQLGSRVSLIRQEPRAGKTAALNAAMKVARGDVVVFSDANSIYAQGAIRRLVANFADPSVGYVTGKMVYVDADGSLVGDGCSAYMKYENWLRSQESKLASVIGVDGGIDAVRKSLYLPMEASQQPDFVLPLSIAERGFRVVYEPAALLNESSLSETSTEFRMRVRVSLRAMWALWDKRSIFLSGNPLLAFQVFSHKVLRYFAFVPLLTAFVTSWMGAADNLVLLAAAVAQTAFYILAGIGWVFGGRLRGAAFSVPYYFTLVNVAAAFASLKFLARQRQVIWTPRAG